MNEIVSTQKNIENSKDFYKSFVFFNKFQKTNWYFLTTGIIVLVLLFIVIFYPFPGQQVVSLLDRISKENGGTGNVNSGIYLIFGRYANVLYFTDISNLVFGFSILLVAFNNHQKSKNIFFISLASVAIASFVLNFLISFFIKFSITKPIISVIKCKKIVVNTLDQEFQFIK